MMGCPSGPGVTCGTRFPGRYQESSEREGDTNERVGPKRESPKEDCVAWPWRSSRGMPNRTLCGVADVVGVPPCAAFLSSDPDDIPSVAVFPSAGAPCETSWYHVPAVAVCFSSDVEDVPLVATVEWPWEHCEKHPGQCRGKPARGRGDGPEPYATWHPKPEPRSGGRG